MILGYFHTVSGSGGMDRHRGIFIERIATCTPTKNRHKGDYQVSASHRSGTMYCGVVARAEGTGGVAGPFVAISIRPSLEDRQ